MFSISIFYIYLSVFIVIYISSPSCLLFPVWLFSSLVFFLVPEPLLETTVDDDENSVVLLNLLPGTEYKVQLTAAYPLGESEPLLVTGKTRKHPYTTLL